MHRVNPLLLVLHPGLSVAAAEDIVVIEGGARRPGIRLVDFDMPARSVAKPNHRQFVDDTRCAPPPAWTAGRAQHPVRRA